MGKSYVGLQFFLSPHQLVKLYKDVKYNILGISLVYTSHLKFVIIIRKEKQTIAKYMDNHIS